MTRVVVWVGSEFAPPAPGHSSLETMTQEDYTPDFRALCAELLEALENAIRIIYNEDGTKHISTADSVITKADAALAQPESQRPTDEEILALSQEHQVSYTMCNGHVIYPKQEGCDMRDDVLSFTRAVLARWGK